MRVSARLVKNNLPISSLKNLLSSSLPHFLSSPKNNTQFSLLILFEFLTSLFHIPSGGDILKKAGNQLRQKISNQIGMDKICFRFPLKSKLPRRQMSIGSFKTARRSQYKIANPVLKLSPYFHFRPLKQKHGFSLIGILVSSAIGLIVIAGFTKMFAHMSSQMSQFEQKIERMNLITFLGNYMNHPGHCKKTLDQVSTQISAGTNTSLDKIMLEHGGTALDIVAEKNKLKTKYGLEGFVDFQLNCDETGGTDPCKKCTGTYPCPSVKWSLSLISQTYINDIPSMNRVVDLPIVVTHTGPNDSDFECNSASQAQVGCERGAIEGFDSHGNKKCFYLCPKGKLRKNGFGCDCPTGHFWTGTQCVEDCSNAADKKIKINTTCTKFLFERQGHFAAIIPSLGVFVPLDHLQLHPDFTLNPSNHLNEQLKNIYKFGESVTGFDENGNKVSFKPCPSGQTWIGSQCLEYCQNTGNATLRQTSFTPLTSGVKINGSCYIPCIKSNSIHNDGCSFQHEARLWVQTLF